MDKQDFYNSYNEITEEALSTCKLPFLKESLGKNLLETQKLSNSLRDNMNNFFVKKAGALNNYDSQFSDDFNETMDSLIEGFEKMGTLFSETNEIITELKQNYSPSDLDFLPEQERQILTFVYDTFMTTTPSFANYLTQYKKWLDNPQNLPQSKKDQISKETNERNREELEALMRKRMSMLQQTRNKTNRR